MIMIKENKLVLSAIKHFELRSINRAHDYYQGEQAQ